MPRMKFNDVCPSCGNSDIEQITYSDTVAFRNVELDVEGLQTLHCKKCKHKWVESAQSAHNHELLKKEYYLFRDKVRTEQGLLSSREISNIRQTLHLNKREASALFGGGFNAFNKYESGEVLQSYAMDRLLRLVSAIGQPAIDFLRNPTKTRLYVGSLPSYDRKSQTLFLENRYKRHTTGIHQPQSQIFGLATTAHVAVQGISFNPHIHERA